MACADDETCIANETCKSLKGHAQRIERMEHQLWIVAREAENNTERSKEGIDLAREGIEIAKVTSNQVTELREELTPVLQVMPQISSIMSDAQTVSAAAEVVQRRTKKAAMWAGGVLGVYMAWHAAWEHVVEGWHHFQSWVHR